MFHNNFTINQLSNYFRTTAIITTSCLLAISIQNYYLPNFTTLELIIENISNANLFASAIIVILTMLWYLSKTHHNFIKKHISITHFISVIIAIFFFLLLIVSHHLEISFIQFYEKRSITNHHLKTIYLFILIIIMFLFEIYDLINNENRAKKEFIKKFLSSKINEYLAICTLLLGLFYLGKAESLILWNQSIWLYIILYIFMIILCIMINYSYNKNLKI